ncbi:hypothetical protein Tco_0187798, partial [Tanacetum coccineum]
ETTDEEEGNLDDDVHTEEDKQTDDEAHDDVEKLDDVNEEMNNAENADKVKDDQVMVDTKKVIAEKTEEEKVNKEQTGADQAKDEQTKDVHAEYDQAGALISSLSLSSNYGNQFLNLSSDTYLVDTVKENTKAEINSLLDVQI